MGTSKNSSFLELRVDAVRLGLPLAQVERVLRAAAVTPVPGVRGCLLGLLDVHGTLTPVYDTRKLLGLPARALRASDRIVLARDASGACGFIADDVTTAAGPELLAAPDSFGVQASGLRGIARVGDDLLFVRDLRQFLYLDRAVPIAAAA